MALALDPGQCARLVGYLSVLHRWNRVYNLSAVRDPVQMVRRHVLDSLGVLPFVRGRVLLDVGSGAGLPGLVLAIARPDTHCVLLDRAAKRVRFLVQCVAELELDNTDPVRGRIQDYPTSRRFPTIVSRAALAPAVLWGASERLLAPGGRVVAMQAGRPEAELAQLGASGVHHCVVACRVPGPGVARHVVVMERRRAT